MLDLSINPKKAQEKVRKRINAGFFQSIETLLTLRASSRHAFEARWAARANDDQLPHLKAHQHNANYISLQALREYP
jgi:hypothetical protein